MSDNTLTTQDIPTLQKLLAIAKGSVAEPVMKPEYAYEQILAYRAHMSWLAILCDKMIGELMPPDTSGPQGAAPQDIPKGLNGPSGPNFATQRGR